MEIEQDMLIFCLRGLQFSWSSSEEGCQKWSSFPSPGIQQQSKGSLFCQAPSPEEEARETQAQLATALGLWGRGTCPVSPATNFSYFGS